MTRTPPDPLYQLSRTEQKSMEAALRGSGAVREVIGEDAPPPTGSNTSMESLIMRLRRGATASTDIGVHLRKYQFLCDEAAIALRTAERERDEFRKQNNWLIECNGRSAVRAERAEDIASEAERERDEARKALQTALDILNGKPSSVNAQDAIDKARAALAAGRGG